MKNIFQNFLMRFFGFFRIFHYKGLLNILYVTNFQDFLKTSLLTKNKDIWPNWQTFDKKFTDIWQQFDKNLTKTLTKKFEKKIDKKMTKTWQRFDKNSTKFDKKLTKKFEKKITKNDKNWQKMTKNWQKFDRKYLTKI